MMFLPDDIIIVLAMSHSVVTPSLCLCTYTHRYFVPRILNNLNNNNNNNSQDQAKSYSHKSTRVSQV